MTGWYVLDLDVVVECPIGECPVYLAHQWSYSVPESVPRDKAESKLLAKVSGDVLNDHHQAGQLHTTWPGSP